jgi:hypothetical protein
MARLVSQMARLDALARFLDTRFTIPGTGIRFGLDGLLGLIPGVGDAATGLLSAYLIGEAAQMGARKRTLLRMVWNAGIDMALGSIPVVGDIFDFAFKANSRNLALLRAELAHGNFHPENSDVR